MLESSEFSNLKYSEISNWNPGNIDMESSELANWNQVKEANWNPVNELIWNLVNLTNLSPVN